MTDLQGILRRALTTGPTGSLCVGFSGGSDSTALLHALAQLPEARARGLRAVHVDHGLQADSRAWAEHCRRLCKTLDVPLAVHRVHVARQGGSGVEAAAREARYKAFADALHKGESLLTAHHRDDQAETVLLKLLRGAGPEGLGGMRAHRPFAVGWLWRPLLDTPHAVLVDYVHAHHLPVIDDPSNQSTHYARNFLRADILPRLAGHWPQAPQSIGHAARLQRDTADFLHQCSTEKRQLLQDPSDASLDANGWADLHVALRGPVLEQWLHAQHLPAPTTKQREQLLQQIREAAADRVPQVDWPGTVVHVWRGRLYAHPPMPPTPPRWHATWDGQLLPLPGAAGTLALSGELPPSLQLDVRLGETGLHLRPTGDTHTRQLRDLFQRSAIVPWLRRHCPAIYAGDGTLLAIADLWLTEAGQQWQDQHRAQFVWTPLLAHPLRPRAP
ncbi:MAG TPA: tRNA lysidine(34) synthetase TilS [Rhodanobacteraceae bacterium]